MSEETETQDVKKEETSEETSANEELEVEEKTVEETENEEETSKDANLHARLKELTEDNKRQQALLNQLMVLGMNQQSVNVIQDQDEKEEIDPVIAKKLRSLEQRQTQQFQEILGGVLEEMDKTTILASPKASLYKKYQQEVETYRQQMGAQGRFFKREEALANVLLNKNLLEGEKPKPKKIIKQKIAPGGNTQNAAPVKKKDEKPLSLKERLAGKTF